MQTIGQKSQSGQWSLSQYVIGQVLVVLTMLVLGAFELYRRGDTYSNSIMPYLGLFETVGQLAFLTTLIHFVWQYKFSWRQRCLTTATYLGLYLLSYVLLSSAGAYHGSRSGEYRHPQAGLAVVDQSIWHAKGVFWQPFTQLGGKQTSQATSLGYFYAPLIVVDQQQWHKSRKIFE